MFEIDKEKIEEAINDRISAKTLAPGDVFEVLISGDGGTTNTGQRKIFVEYIGKNKNKRIKKGLFYNQANVTDVHQFEVAYFLEGNNEKYGKINNSISNIFEGEILGKGSFGLVLKKRTLYCFEKKESLLRESSKKEEKNNQKEKKKSEFIYIDNKIVKHLRSRKTDDITADCENEVQIYNSLKLEQEEKSQYKKITHGTETFYFLTQMQLEKTAGVKDSPYTHGEIASLHQQIKQLNAKRIMHLDIKPKNMIRQAGMDEVRLIDFGLSCFRDQLSPFDVKKIFRGSNAFKPFYSILKQEATLGSIQTVEHNNQLYFYAMQFFYKPLQNFTQEELNLLKACIRGASDNIKSYSTEVNEESFALRIKKIENKIEKLDKDSCKNEIFSEQMWYWLKAYLKKADIKKNLTDTLIKKIDQKLVKYDFQSKYFAFNTMDIHAGNLSVIASFLKMESFRCILKCMYVSNDNRDQGIEKSFFERIKELNISEEDLKDNDIALGAGITKKEIATVLTRLIKHEDSNDQIPNDPKMAFEDLQFYVDFLKEKMINQKKIFSDTDGDFQFSSAAEKKLKQVVCTIQTLSYEAKQDPIYYLLIREALYQALQALSQEDVTEKFKAFLPDFNHNATNPASAYVHYDFIGKDPSPQAKILFAKMDSDKNFTTARKQEKRKELLKNSINTFFILDKISGEKIVISNKNEENLTNNKHAENFIKSAKEIKKSAFYKAIAHRVKQLDMDLNTWDLGEQTKAGWRPQFSFASGLEIICMNNEVKPQPAYSVTLKSIGERIIEDQIVLAENTKAIYASVPKLDAPIKQNIDQLTASPDGLINYFDAKKILPDPAGLIFERRNKEKLRLSTYQKILSALDSYDFQSVIELLSRLPEKDRLILAHSLPQNIASSPPFMAQQTYESTKTLYDIALLKEIESVDEHANEKKQMTPDNKGNKSALKALLSAQEDLALLSEDERRDPVLLKSLKDRDESFLRGALQDKNESVLKKEVERKSESNDGSEKSITKKNRLFISSKTVSPSAIQQDLPRALESYKEEKTSSLLMAGLSFLASLLIAGLLTVAGLAFMLLFLTMLPFFLLIILLAVMAVVITAALSCGAVFISMHLRHYVDVRDAETHTSLLNTELEIFSKKKVN